MSDLVAPSTVADLLAFEAWPDELQQIARRALGRRLDDMGYPIDDETIYAKEEAKEEAEGEADDRWAVAREHIAGVLKKLREAKKLCIDTDDRVGETFDAIDALLTTAIDMLEALPEDFADLEDDA